ncbi:hypothetical protein EOL73_01510 [Candidatus Saccharibacteria bacterium]|nr:hypothetical protein [Candidatus Saccharibacteria bacterium]NCU40413.1 hypothetical protein [Candidatus Saccharibacteria bacterium]
MTPKDINQNSFVGIITSLRGLTVEVQLIGDRPDTKELLTVPEYPEVFVEVNFFKGDKAICLNLNNDTVLECGQKLYTYTEKLAK